MSGSPNNYNVLPLIFTFQHFNEFFYLEKRVTLFEKMVETFSAAQKLDAGFPAVVSNDRTDYFKHVLQINYIELKFWQKRKIN